jgi:cytochrome c biogenesis protein CcmG/thiol:disulfide interchange protein DsbE
MLAALLAVVLATAPQPFQAGATRGAATEAAPSPLALGNRAPTLTGVTPEGRSVAADWSSGAATVVIFFATWCQPCHRALRELRAIGQTIGPRVRFMLLDAGDDPSKVRRFIGENPIPEGAVVIDDPSGSEKDRWGCPILPTLFIVDQTGIVRYINHGWGDGSEAKYQRRVQNVLRGP